jgi:hypothetical protein
MLIQAPTLNGGLSRRRRFTERRERACFERANEVEDFKRMPVDLPGRKMGDPRRGFPLRPSERPRRRAQSVPRCSSSSGNRRRRSGSAPRTCSVCAADSTALSHRVCGRRCRTRAKPTHCISERRGQSPLPRKLGRDRIRVVHLRLCDRSFSRPDATTLKRTAPVQSERPTTQDRLAFVQADHQPERHHQCPDLRRRRC